MPPIYFLGCSAPLMLPLLTTCGARRSRLSSERNLASAERAFVSLKTRLLGCCAALRLTEQSLFEGRGSEDHRLCECKKGEPQPKNQKV